MGEFPQSWAAENTQDEREARGVEFMDGFTPQQAAYAADDDPELFGYEFHFPKPGEKREA